MLLIDPMIYYDKNINEVWKPLVFEGVKNNEYLISNLGNVYDLLNKKYVIPRINSINGYVYICLRTISNDFNNSVLLHRVVAENFVGERREDQVQVNHKNGIKTINTDMNLEWASPKENTRHAFETGLAINNIGECSHLSKLTENQVENICKLLSDGKRYNEILDIIGLEDTCNNRELIGNIYRGIAWKHISKKYTFQKYDDRFRTNSEETIHAICKAIEDGLNNKEVYEKVFNTKVSIVTKDSEYKKKYETIRLIRNKKIFTDISKLYSF